MPKDFNDEVKINRFKLEEECERQVPLFHLYANKRAQAKAELDEKEDSLKLVSAECELEIRNKWNETKWGKQTENAIKSRMEMDKQILHARNEVREAQAAVYTLDAAVSTLEHRKSELDNLVTLLVKGFYAAPNGGKREGPSEQAEGSVRKGLNKSSKGKE